MDWSPKRSTRETVIGPQTRLLVPIQKVLLSEISKSTNREESASLNRRDLVRGFLDLGLGSEDVVLVHSSYRSLGDVEGGPQTVVDALLEIIGHKGTLVVPTFTLSFCEQYNREGNGYFDLDNTPSEMGILTETVRKMPGAKRSLHPIHSFAVYGRFTDEITSLGDRSSFGAGSGLAKLHELDAKIMVIGLRYTNSMTFFRYIEQMVGTEYRYIKEFSGSIIVRGAMTQGKYTMNVRDLDRNVVTDNEPMGRILEEMGLVRVKKIGQSSVRLVLSTRDIYRVVTRELENNPKLFYPTATG